MGFLLLRARARDVSEHQDAALSKRRVGDACPAMSVALPARPRRRRRVRRCRAVTRPCPPTRPAQRSRRIAVGFSAHDVNFSGACERCRRVNNLSRFNLRIIFRDVRKQRGKARHSFMFSPVDGGLSYIFGRATRSRSAQSASRAFSLISDPRRTPGRRRARCR